MCLLQINDTWNEIESTLAMGNREQLVSAPDGNISMGRGLEGGEAVNERGRLPGYVPEALRSKNVK